MKQDIQKDKTYLVIFNDNWADEMDIDGFFTCSGEYLLDAKKKLFKHKNSINYGIGTNEDIEYDNGKALWETLDIKEISDDEVAVLYKLFGGNEDETPEERIERIIDDHIYELVEKEIGSFNMPWPDYNKTDYDEKRKEYAKKQDEHTKLWESAEKRLKKENKHKFDEIVAAGLIKEKEQERINMIAEALENEGFEYEEEKELDDKIQSLSTEEQERLFEKGKKLSRLGDVQFGFCDILDDIDEDDDEEDDN